MKMKDARSLPAFAQEELHHIGSEGCFG